MKLEQDQVRHIAELAKLGLSPEEVELFADQLSEILDYAEILDRLDTDSIPPTAQVQELHNVTRADRVTPSLSQEEVLANAPQRHNDYFKVKPILE